MAKEIAPNEIASDFLFGSFVFFFLEEFLLICIKSFDIPRYVLSSHLYYGSGNISAELLLFSPFPCDI